MPFFVIGEWLIYLAAIFLVYFAACPAYYSLKKNEIFNKENREDNFVSKKIYTSSVSIVLLITLLKLIGKAIEMNLQGKIHLVFYIIYIINCVLIFFVLCYILGILVFVSTYRNYKSYQKLTIIIIIILILSVFKNIYYLTLIVIFVDYIFRKNQNKLSRKSKKIIEITTTTVIVGLLLSFVFLFNTVLNVNEDKKLKLKEGPLDLDEGLILNVIKADGLPEKFDFNIKYNNFETETFKAIIKEDVIRTEEMSGQTRLKIHEKDFLENKNEIRYKNNFEDVVRRIIENEINMSLTDNFNFNYSGNQYDLEYNIYNSSRMGKFERDYNIRVQKNQDLINLYFKFDSERDNRTALEEDFLKTFSVKEQKEEIKRLIKTKMNIFQKIKKKDYVVAVVGSNDVTQQKTRISPHFVYKVSIDDNEEVNVEKHPLFYWYLKKTERKLVCMDWLEAIFLYVIIYSGFIVIPATLFYYLIKKKEKSNSLKEDFIKKYTYRIAIVLSCLFFILDLITRTDESFLFLLNRGSYLIYLPLAEILLRNLLVGFLVAVVLYSKLKDPYRNISYLAIATVIVSLTILPDLLIIIFVLIYDYVERKNKGLNLKKDT